MTTPQIPTEKIDPDAIKVVERLRRFDHTAYLVGGCVRDLLLGGKPKDFDVATSATPNEIRRLFRNCRIIGRRFRLAHIFFGQKVIETATFRANPREAEDDDAANAESAAPAPGGATANELLIKRDNVFGTAEEDARRRDFTINGLFLDVETGQIIDHVNGLPDIEARLVRTIGDPDIRFREDPVRILRAVKFAARCRLDVEPETYRRMMDHAGEIAKCAQARVSEEFFRLLRAGAAEPSMRLLVRTKLLDVLAPALSRWLEVAGADPALAAQQELFWKYLAALDATTVRRDATPSNALILATVLLAPVRSTLFPDPTAPRTGDFANKLTEAIGPIVEQVKASRRDSDAARQLLVMLRHYAPDAQPGRRRPRFGSREFGLDVLRLVEIAWEAEGVSDAATKVGEMLAELAPRSAPPVAAHVVGTSGPPSEAPARPAAIAPSGRALPPIPQVSPIGTTGRPAFLGTGAFGRWGAHATVD
jgi:poly(A) polymerase